MTPEPFAGKRIGSIRPVLIRSSDPPVTARLDYLVERSADPLERTPGWLGVRELSELPGGLRAAWIQFLVTEDDITGDSMENTERILLADVPRADASGRMLLVGGANTTSDFVVGEYAEALGLEMREFRSVPITGDTLKVIFQDPALYDAVTAVESTEQRIDVEYRGDTRIKTPKDYDIRNDSKFGSVVDQPWKRLRFLPNPGAFDYEGLPPAVELSDSGTVRLWKEWDDSRMVPFLRKICERVLQAQGEDVDEERFQLATQPPYAQSRLGDY